jgi:hypothetical protein
MTLNALRRSCARRDQQAGLWAMEEQLATCLQDVQGESSPRPALAQPCCGLTWLAWPCLALQERLSVEEAHLLHIPRSALPPLQSDSTAEQRQDLNLTITRADLEAAIASTLALVEALVHENLAALACSEQPDGDGEAKDSRTTPSAHIHSKGKDDATTPTVAQDMQLDEVVLVGGCSRMPCIQQALLRACKRAGMNRFTSKDALCASVDPSTVVAQGLAIQGARIGKAISESAIQDLLVFDVMARTLGLVVWERSSGAPSAPLEKYFEPMVAVGSKLPITVKKRFQLGTSKQKYVSLDIYEETEELLEPNISQAADESSSQCEKRMRYSLIMALDAPIQYSDAAASTSNTVEVIFTVSGDQEMAYEVVQVADTEEAHSEEQRRTLVHTRNEQSTWSQSRMLVLYIVFLLALYILCKAYLNRGIDGETISASESTASQEFREGSESITTSIIQQPTPLLSDAVAVEKPAQSLVATCPPPLVTASGSSLSVQQGANMWQALHMLRIAATVLLSDAKLLLQRCVDQVKLLLRI